MLWYVDDLNKEIQVMLISLNLLIKLPLIWNYLLLHCNGFSSYRIKSRINSLCWCWIEDDDGQLNVEPHDFNNLANLDVDGINQNIEGIIVINGDETQVASNTIIITGQANDNDI